MRTRFFLELLDVENAALEISSKPGAPIEAFFASVGVNGFDGDFWRSQLDFREK